MASAETSVILRRHRIVIGSVSAHLMSHAWNYRKGMPHGRLDDLVRFRVFDL